MRRLMIAATRLILIGAGQSAEPPRTPEARAILDKWLGGRVAGETRTCLPMAKTNNPIGVDDHTMLFATARGSGATTSAKHQLREGRKPYSLVSSAALTAGRICTGAVVEIVDMHDPTEAVGACELGSFTVYQKP